MNTLLTAILEDTGRESNTTLARVCLRHVGKMPVADGAKPELLAAAQVFASLAIAEQLEKLVYRYEQVTDRAYNG
jgi:hypothetical protein